MSDLYSCEDARNELLDLVEEYPILSAALPLHHLAAHVGCSTEAIEFAEELSLAPEFPSIELANEVAEAMPTDDKPEPEREVLGEIGALQRWQSEVTAGVRKKADCDVLTRAAIHEINSRDELRLGMLSAARKSRLDAADCIISASGGHVA